MAVNVDGANAADGEHMSDLTDEVNESGNPIGKLYGDSAYSNWSEIEKREQEGMEFCTKQSQPANPRGGYTKNDFNIDIEKGMQ